MSRETYGLFGKSILGNNLQFIANNILSQKFIIPPFSILDTRTKQWQDRSNAWKRIGIKSEIGRITRAYHDQEWCKNVSESSLCSNQDGEGTSIFDPVLCELIYEWFSNPNDQVVDPFSGGSVRGIVASILDRKYFGIDLSKEQIKSNVEQVNNILKENKPIYEIEDAEKLALKSPMADLLFTCPPYGNLEKYSNDENDLSNMTYEDFLQKLSKIISLFSKKLKLNKYAVFVVGNFRDKKGYLNDLVGNISSICKSNSLPLYNEIILINSFGSLPIRITKQFENSRKIGKMHQNILVFKKGNE